MLSHKPEDVGTEGWDTFGYFWMSGDKRRKQPGRLSWKPTQGGELRLFEPIVSTKQDFFWNVSEQIDINEDKRIFGISAGSSGQKYTLERGLMRRPTEVDISRIWHGVHLPKSRFLPGGKFCTISLSNSIGWLGVNQDSDFDFDSREFKISQTYTEEREPLFYSSGEKFGDIIIQRGVGQNTRLRLGSQLFQLPSFRINYNSSRNADLDKLLIIAKSLSTIITLGSSKSALVHPISFANNSLGYPKCVLYGGVNHEMSIVENNWRSQDIDISKMLFSYESIGASEGLSKYLMSAVEKGIEGMNHMISKFIFDNKFIDNEFQNLALAAEATYKLSTKSNKSIDFDTVLKWLISKIDNSITTRPPDNWIKTCCKIRNNITSHYGIGNEKYYYNMSECIDILYPLVVNAHLITYGIKSENAKEVFRNNSRYQNAIPIFGDIT